MKKVLVCGSAGFLMANMIRYMLYRSKDFDFVSIDKLNLKNSYKNVYLNKKHIFHIGDAGNLTFMEKIINVENPDVIIIATNSVDESYMSKIDDIVLPTSVICTVFKKHIIRIVPDIEIQNDKPLWNFVESMVLKNEGTIVRLPTCFGKRGKGLIEKNIENMIKHNNLILDNTQKRYVYSDDVSSFLWFIIENNIKKEIINMPALGRTSLNNIFNTSEEIDGSEESLNDWIPDSISMRDSIQKTIRWYTMNSWIFS